MNATGPHAPAPQLRSETPGRMGIVLAGLSVGLTLLVIQLWLLTVALDLLLAGRGGEIWRIAIGSAAIFGGGLLMMRLLQRKPRVHRAKRH